MNVFEAVDVITLIKDSNYDSLALNVGDALQERADVRIIPFPSHQFSSFLALSVPPSSNLFVSSPTPLSLFFPPP